MRILLLFLVLSVLPAIVQTQTPATDETPPMTVASYKWSRARQAAEAPHVDAPIPVRQVIPPDKDKELEGFSFAGPSDVVSVGALADKSRFKENVLINRIEYSEGSIWQRKGWHLAEVKGSYDRVLREPWVPGQCKGL